MMATDIYIEVASGMRKSVRRWGYALKAPGADPKYKTGESKGTLHEVTLRVLIGALSRYRRPSRITIHAADAWVLNIRMQ